MSAITKESVAGTLESSDAMVYASPNPGGGRLISINSSVGQQFAPQIKASAEAVLNRLNIEDVWPCKSKTKARSTACCRPV